MNADAEHPAIQVPDPPRAVPQRFYLRRMRAMFLCGILFAVLGTVLGVGLPVLMLALADSALPTADLALDRNHASATATITDTEYMRHTRMKDSHPWKVSFRFTDEQDNPVEAVGFTYDQSMRDKAPGETIAVEYDPAQPTRARPVGGSASLLPLWAYALIMGLLLPESVGGVILLILVAVRARRERILLTYGPVAVATVTSVVRRSHIHFGSKSPYDVYYEFSDHLGRRVAGKDRTYHYDWAAALNTGDKVGVAYDPQAPAANVLWLHGADEQRAQQATPW